jgi:hypothetical protein
VAGRWAEPDQLFDHLAVEYSFADGTRLVAQGRHMTAAGASSATRSRAKGSAVLGEGSATRRSSGAPARDRDILWRYEGPPCNVQAEHDLLFEAIRQDKPTTTKRARAGRLTGIMGRMAIESGQRVT